ncbi:hypothetical protein [Marinicellulosiphila megalodicopiae]|uniref:hypothetical protein n=1 Tax=Marinicellulosiphila megalodicopiae TaxID=2724896 RepID=UPI003BB02902
MIILGVLTELSYANIHGQIETANNTLSTKNWHITTEAVAYLYNYEWFEEHGAQGYTLFGNIAPIYASRQLNSRVELDIGAIGFIKYGSDSQNTIKPLFRLNIDLNNDQNLILGVLNQSHDIHQGLSMDNDFYQQQVEQGIQYLNSSQRNNMDLWANWKVAETENTAEYFEVGAIHSNRFLKSKNMHLFTNEQIFITHKGGQETNDNQFEKGTWLQMKLGGQYRDNQISVALLSSKYENELINNKLATAFQVNYNKTWNRINNKIKLNASHFINNQFYNPKGHTGYNQKSFSNISIESNWLRSDQLSISTGLSLDWINGSFSTVQYLNISLIAK